MSWSDIAPLYGHFGTDWIAMEATEADRSSSSSCVSARPRFFRSPNPLQIPAALLLRLLWHRHNSRSSNGGESIHRPLNYLGTTGPMYAVRRI